ncbi:hypothetical protein C8R46DRAFT_438954 [Mycena filopes]|nr:hypothetical protein C8R46DRAFT_438954 [Mycena filopes]
MGSSAPASECTATENPPELPLGDPRVPPELMLEIASFLIEPPYAYVPEPEQRKAQMKAWLMLSHSCSIFRGVFLPHLWASLDAFFVDTAYSGDDALGRLDLRMREILQAEHIIKHVKLVSLSLHGPALTPDRAAAFVACLCAFPNLAGPKIISMAPDRPLGVPQNFDYLCNAFRPHTFPSIKRLVLPDALSPVLSCFPQMRSLCSGEPDLRAGGLHLIRDASLQCPQLEEVLYGGVSRGIIGLIAVALPNIQRLILRNTLFEGDFPLMRTLTNLVYLEFAHRVYPESNDAPRFLSLADCEKHGRALLALSRNPAPKKLRIPTLEGRTMIYRGEKVVQLP